MKNVSFKLFRSMKNGKENLGLQVIATHYGSILEEDLCGTLGWMDVLDWEDEIADENVNGVGRRSILMQGEIVDPLDYS